MSRAERFTKYIEHVAHCRRLAWEWRKEDEDGRTSFASLADKADQDAETWLELIDHELKELAKTAVDHALMVAQHHTEKNRPFGTLNVSSLAKESLELWKEKNRV